MFVSLACALRNYENMGHRIAKSAQLQRCCNVYSLLGSNTVESGRLSRTVRRDLTDLPENMPSASVPHESLPRVRWGYKPTLCGLLRVLSAPRRNTQFQTVTLLSRKRVCRAVAQKRSLFTESPLSNGSIRHSTNV
jgi:hypothetical protein